MSQEHFSKQQWTELFRQIGLDDDTMHRWHALFEQRWPGTHHSFLQWLGASEAEVARIREASRGPWTEQ